MNLVLDIETAPARVADYCKIFPDKLDDDGNPWKKPSLHSILSKVVCIGLLPLDGEPIVLCGPDEAKHMRTLESILSASRPRSFITHNATNFDFWHLRWAAVRADIKIGEYLPDGPKDARCIDIYQKLQGKYGTEYSSASLSELIWAMFGSAKQTDGADVAKWVEEGNWKAIEDHCIEDICGTRDVYLKGKGNLWA